MYSADTRRAADRTLAIYHDVTKEGPLEARSAVARRRMRCALIVAVVAHSDGTTTQKDRRLGWRGVSQGSRGRNRVEEQAPATPSIVM